MSHLRLTAPGLPDTPPWHLSVDGMSPAGPNLSHWPGNRTPEGWKADLSTEICLNFADASEGEQAEFLAGATAVLNDHYDTDGFLSLLAVLRPDVALPRRDTLLAAAATGDYQSFQGENGFAIDRIVCNLAAPFSPLQAEFEGLPGPAEKDLARYRWLVDHAEAILDEPRQFKALFADELAEVQRQLGDDSIRTTLLPDAGLALIRSVGPVHRTVLNTVAQRCFRVLHSQASDAGHRFRFHDRTESWFEVRTFTPPPRRDLTPVLESLRELEPPHDLTAQWCLDPSDEPVPELYFGIPSTQAYGQLTRRLLPSRIPPADVEARLVAFFGSNE